MEPGVFQAQGVVYFTTMALVELQLQLLLPWTWNQQSATIRGTRVSVTCWGAEIGKFLDFWDFKDF